MSIYQFLKIDMSLINSLRDQFEILLKDKDPVITTCALHILDMLIDYNSLFFKKRYLPVVIHICQQIFRRHISYDYYYNGIPIPFTIILLIKILGKMGVADKKLSSKIYSIMSDFSQFCNLKEDTYIHLAITYEWIKSIVKIYPNLVLLKKSVKLIHELLHHNRGLIETDIYYSNYYYIAASCLNNLLKYQSPYAFEFRYTVAKLMRESDISIKAVGISILLDIACFENIKFVIDNILQFFNTCYDVETRDRFMIQITDMLERYSPNPKYYIEILTKLLYYCGEKHANRIINIIINLLKEGVGDENLTKSFRLDALDIYTNIIGNYTVSSKYVAQVGLYVIGEYSYLSSIDNIPTYYQAIYDIFEPNFNPILTCYCISAVTKIYYKTNVDFYLIDRMIEKGLKMSNVDINNRCKMLRGIRKYINPYLQFDIYRDTKQTIDVKENDSDDENDEDNTIDEDLTFLDSYTDEMKSKSAKPYHQVEMDDDEVFKYKLIAALKYDPYQLKSLVRITQIDDGVDEVAGVITTPKYTIGSKLPDLPNGGGFLARVMRNSRLAQKSSSLLDDEDG